jgi:L-amino acid N-acyltransferase YncA
MATDLSIEITTYVPGDHSELLRLLLELHTTYFHQTASPQIQELELDHDIRNSYGTYVDFLDKNRDNNWKVFVARSAPKQLVGFIIGSIVSDPALVYNKVGKFEDWFVEPGHRKKGTGLKLYSELENWFRANGCMQVQSDTWQGNELSIHAHERLGFFVSGIRFSKKL